MLTNKLTVVGTQFFHGYFATISPKYLFSKGNDNPWHSLQLIQIGSFQWGFIPFFLIGVYLLIKKFPKYSPGEMFVIFYFFVSPMINSLTLDAPNTNRLMDFHLSITLIAALGLSFSIDQLRAHSQKVYKIIPALLMGYFLISWGHSYFRYLALHTSQLDVKWNEGVGQTANVVSSLGKDADVIYLDTSALPEDILLYSHFALYTKLDPAVFQRTASWNTAYSFVSPDSYGPFKRISDLNLNDLSVHTINQYFPEGKNVIIFVKRLKVSDHVSPYHTALVNNYVGEPIWEIVKIDRRNLPTFFDSTVNSQK